MLSVSHAAVKVADLRPWQPATGDLDSLCCFLSPIDFVSAAAQDRLRRWLPLPGPQGHLCPPGAWHLAWVELTEAPSCALGFSQCPPPFPAELSPPPGSLPEYFSPDRGKVYPDSHISSVRAWVILCDCHAYPSLQQRCELQGPRAEVCLGGRRVPPTPACLHWM